MYIEKKKKPVQCILPRGKPYYTSHVAVNIKVNLEEGNTKATWVLLIHFRASSRFTHTPVLFLTLGSLPLQ